MARKKSEPTPEIFVDDAAFSLTCTGCDNGQHIETRAQADLEGWHDIEEDQTGLFWNYLGLCPECFLREAQEELAFRARRNPLFKDES